MSVLRSESVVRSLALAVFVLPALLQDAAAMDKARLEFFEKKVRPVLVRHCYRCHSRDAKSVQGSLRLDLKSGWQKGGESGDPAVIPGKPDQSPLILAIRHDDSASAMPPGQQRLSDEIVADLATWIRDGAVDPREGPLTSPSSSWQAEFRKRLDWWSLRPARSVSPPGHEDAWSEHPVDRFVLAALRENQLQPASPAAPLTLLRRISYVLTGLPPAGNLVETFPAAFAADPETALDEVIDQLLASPHFGERFARHWMDVVRYTDTYGYEWDNPAKGSWEYRDYLIRAFNNDIGFDQLIREQIAGDLLDTPRIDETSGFTESLIGPMFYHMGEHRHGDNTQINGVREEMIDNKIDAFSKAFLAMTVACARCHDHKLDAISQTDYYALAGVFMTPRWTSRSIESPQKNATQIASLKSLREDIRKRTGELWLDSVRQHVSGNAIRQWAMANRSQLKSARLGDVEWLLRQFVTEPLWLAISDLKVSAAEPKTQLRIQKDGSILAAGPVPQSDSYTVRFRTPPGRTDVLRLQALTHESLGQSGPGRTAHGNFVLSHLHVAVRSVGRPDESGDSEPLEQQIRFRSARADYSQPNYPVEDALDPVAQKGWGVGLGGNVDRTAWFQFAEPVNLPNGGEWTVTLDHHYGSSHVLGRFRISLGTETTAANLDTEQIRNRWEQLRSEWRQASGARSQANATKFAVPVGFSKGKLPEGWVIDGDGLKNGWVAGGEPLVSLEGTSAVRRILPRGWHTHALSSKLPGALRLPSQERIPGRFVSVELAGGEWSGFLRQADNGFQTETVTFLRHPQPGWRTLADLAAPNGIQRVAWEIATSDLNPNFPPRTGVAQAAGVRLPDNDEGFDKRSWFSVTGVVTHDQPGQPADELQRFTNLFRQAPASSREAWNAIGKWLVESVQRYGQHRADEGDVKLLNWLLDRELLPNSLSDDQRLSELVEEYRKLEQSLPYPRTANSMDERQVTPVDYALNIRGDIDVRGERVPRRLPSAFFESGLATSIAQEDRLTGEGSGRLALSRFLTDPQHGLAARVYVNRIWQWVFGAGLVRTPNDFGHLGESPSHPELLDFLTREFIRENWSTKRLLKRLLLSRTFRQSGRISAQGARTDPDNRLLHHYPTRRLEAEAIRDALLSTSGRLDSRLFGRPVNPRRHTEDAKKRLFSGPLDGHGRRSIYLEVSIMDRSKFLQNFNAPDPKLPTGRRDVTSVPAQALVMLNDPFVIAMADYWAAQLVEEDSRSVESRIHAMFLRALGRPPEEVETVRWVSLARSLARSEDVLRDRDAWKHTAHTMFNLQEFIHYR